MPLWRQPTVPKPGKPWEVSATYPGQSMWRAAAAAFFAFCGALVVLYVFVYSLGGIAPIDSLPLFLAALVLALVWAGAAVYRYRTGAVRVQRPDRERRGF